MGDPAVVEDEEAAEWVLPYGQVTTDHATDDRARTRALHACVTCTCVSGCSGQTNVT